MVEQGLVGFVIAGGQFRRRDLEYGAPDQFFPRLAEEGLEGLVAAQVAGVFVLEEQRAGDRLDELADEMQLFAGGALARCSGR